MRTGLDVLLDDPARLARLAGARVGVACNHTAIDLACDHLVDLLPSRGVALKRIFTPEHGLHATAQDMIHVDDEHHYTRSADRAAPEIVSLYGKTAASLRPLPEQLADLDVLIFDIQDIGSRYYTYQATLGYMMEVAAETGTQVMVLDRPNPIDGITMEGNIVQSGFESFVSAYPLAVRHGMTMGEMARFFRDDCRIGAGVGAGLEVIPCDGWDARQRFDATGLPWVFPSPNMPMVETALIYPGMCLIEGTNLSEGRGTTRPFHLVGAPFLDAGRLTALCRDGALDAGLEGVAFRAATFEPRFQKFAGQVCNGVEIMVTNADALEAFLLGLVVLEAAMRAAPAHFKWRTETYEFVDNPIAIDLLCGSTEARVGLMSKIAPRTLISSWMPQRLAWEQRRAAALIYPRG
ncbi:MAG: DUF1343 domain-containing protein [Myxococcales bacterium]|nr:DUF1343 domain-containing protein [Myxococcales bacterium]